MKLIIGALLIGLLVSVAMGAYQPSFSSFSGFDSIMPDNVASEAIDYCMKGVESLIAFYRDFMESNQIAFFLKSSLPPELLPFAIPLLGSGLAGLLGYGTWRLMK